MKGWIFKKLDLLQDTARTYKWRFWIKKFGKGSFVHGRIIIQYPENIEIGTNSVLNHDVHINARAKVKIGNDVHISCKSILTTGKITLKYDGLQRKHITQEIIIEDGAWIGAAAIILQGVKVGKGAVVGAGSIVNKNVEPFTLVAGVPAQKIKDIV